jgi:hypothetical protein
MLASASTRSRWNRLQDRRDDDERLGRRPSVRLSPYRPLVAAGDLAEGAVPTFRRLVHGSVRSLTERLRLAADPSVVSADAPRADTT